MSSVAQWDSVSGFKQQQPIALAINLGTNVLLSLVTLAAFCWLRPRNGVIYAKKYKSSPHEKRAPKLEQGYFSWIGPVWSCPDSVLFEKIGLDAVVFIRFIRMCRNAFFVMGLVGCGAIIPINIIITKRSQPDGQFPKDKIGMLTIAGIMDLNWLWGHVGAVWFFSLVMFYSVYSAYKSFLKFRIRYFESEAYQEEVASRTIMLAGLPSSLQSDAKLLKFMNDMGLSDKPVQALVGRKVDKLPELMDKHKKAVENLERVVAKYFADPNRKTSTRPTVRVGGLCGSKVDAIDYYSQQIEELTDQIEMTRGQVSKSQPTNYGFVSYATIQSAHRVAKALSDAIAYRKRSKMIDPPDLFLSPVPKDIVWFNVANPKQLRKSRRLIVNAAFIVFSILFFIPMGFLTTITKLDSIIGLFPGSKDYFDSHPFVGGLVQSIVPVLVMDILFLLVRKFISYLAWFQGNITKSSTDRSTLAKFYLFFTLNNLIIFAFAGTLVGFFTGIKSILQDFDFTEGSWQKIKDFIRTQDNIVELLAKSVINTSLFWVNYISLRNFGALLDLSQAVSLVLYWAKSTLTPRESKDMNKPDVFDFPLFFSVHMFLLTVALLYSAIAPLVLFFAFVYFSLASLVYKYQLMYVFRTRVETGGRLFRVVYNRLLVAMVLFQVVMIGVLNLKLAHKHSLALVPLPFMVILFKVFLAKNYDPKIDFYDYGTARDERHLYKGGKNKNILVMSFEDPAFNKKIVSALVPDGAKKMFSHKILHGEGRSKGDKGSGKGTPTHSRGPSRNQSTLQRDDVGKNHESFEMGHVRSGSKTKDGFHVLGPDPYASTDDHHSGTQPPRIQSPVTHSRTGSFSKPVSHTPQEKVYDAQDMTSFVAGRYRVDRAADPYSYSSSNRAKNNGKGNGDGPSYLELAKMHQTDNYKNTGKATQYEDKRALHMPPMNFAKNTRTQRQPHQQHQQQGSLSSLDQASQLPSTPTTPMPSRMQVTDQASSSPRKAHRDVHDLKHTSSSPSLRQGHDDLKPMSRAQTQASIHYSGHNTKYDNDQMVTDLGRTNDSYTSRPQY
ncbi:hypothetical protein B0O80DRAFT_496364 [Mortierella sp. GBAus27b]|nr:hypothetical protein BGX31_001876 [Mortierella sp. GBA43]KAI8357617.1 hypothetical protein B0O80DRAFT_496364 [Mortierella sp. GBAus27b]